MAELSGLSLWDYSDRELLMLVNEQAAGHESGFVDSKTMVKVLGIRGHEHPAHCVGSRLAALKRFGVVERDPSHSSNARWRLTAIGKKVTYGGSSNGIVAKLKRAKVEDVIELTRALSIRQAGAPQAARHMMRREWKRNTEVAR